MSLAHSPKSLPVSGAVHERFAEPELLCYKQMEEMDLLLAPVLVVL